MESANSTTPGEGVDGRTESRQQPLWHVFVLNVITMSAYSLVWFYKNWRDLAEEAHRVSKQLGQAEVALAEGASGGDSLVSESQRVVIKYNNINPLLRTFGLILPGIQIYLAMDLFKDMARLIPHEDSPVRRKPLLASTILITVTVVLFSLACLPGPLFLLFLTAGFPLSMAQAWLNEYWGSVEPRGMVVRQAFSIGEIVAIIVGGSILGLVVTGFAIGAYRT